MPRLYGLIFKMSKITIANWEILEEDLVIVELKAVETMIPVFKAQLLSYLKLTDKPKGLLINFNCVNIKDQLVPLVTDQFMRLPKE